jgi:hypothetical protein
MRRRVLMVLAILGLVLISAAPDEGRTASGQAVDKSQARRSIAVATLRSINAVEYAYKSEHGGFAPWDALVASHEFDGRGMRFAAGNEPQLADAHFAKLPQILPGWVLRLNVNSDGKRYDVLLEDTSDQTCGYAAITNEGGLIRQSKTIDCEL